jgi:peptide deformylase
MLLTNQNKNVILNNMEKNLQAGAEIIQKGNHTLRNISSPIPEDKIKSPEIKSIISALRKAVENQSDAVAIAAVQIGKPIRLFLIGKKVFDIIENNSKNKKRVVQDAGKKTEKKDLIFINPKIIKTSKSKMSLEEGCLSVRYFYGKVHRSEKVTVEAYDEHGKKFTRGFSGFMAQIVQHENDHLNGILFIDKATNVHEVSKKEYERMLVAN